jgi:hypothetical protein
MPATTFPRLLTFATLVASLSAPALAQNRGDFHWEKALPAGNEVSVHNVTGNIKITPSTSGKVEIVGIKRGSSRYFDRVRADVEESSHGISVCVLYDDSDSYCDGRGVHMHGDRDWNDVSMDLELAVPTNLVVSASSVSGNVGITGAQGDIEASSVSGDVRMDRLRASSVRAHSVSGDVEVFVDALTGTGDFTFKTVSGNVTLELPKDFGADLSMSTVSGDVNSDFPMTLGNGRMSRRRIEARIGGGGRRLDVATVSGDLRIRSAK